MRRKKRAFYDNPGIRRQQRLKQERSDAQNAKPDAAPAAGSEVAAARAAPKTRLPVLAIGFASLTVAAFGLPLLRAVGLISWNWVIVLLPLILAGTAFLVINDLSLVAPRFPAVRRLLFGGIDDAPSVTPPPERLEAPLAADSIGEQILTEHPEILAALCLGFRMKGFVPAVMGKPVTDPWGVYSSALLAPSTELAQLHTVARMHVEHYANDPRNMKRGRKSDAELMRHAADHFRQCAEATSRKGRRPNDCPFEHVVVVFGSRAPSRDSHLKSIAPRVRRLLEQQYPQIATASLADGSQVKYSEWQKQALADSKELAHEKKEHERSLRRLQELQDELEKTNTHVDELRASIEEAREVARGAARAEQARVVADLRAESDRSRTEYARELQRLEGDIAKTNAAIEAVTAERDTLEAALFSAAASEDEGPPTDEIQELAGLRVLLVGGDDRQSRPVREHAESCGIQMLHEDSVAAGDLVDSVDIVVFWIRYLSHPKYFAVRRECRVRGTPHCYWMRTSPSGLVSLLLRARESGATVTG